MGSIAFRESTQSSHASEYSMGSCTGVRPLRKTPSGALGKPDIVDDHGIGPDRDLSGIWQVEIDELDLVVPHLAQKVFEHLDRELLARAAPIAETEWGESGVVTNG